MLDGRYDFRIEKSEDENLSYTCTHQFTWRERFTCLTSRSEIRDARVDVFVFFVAF